MNIHTAAARLGMKSREIISAESTDDGVVITTIDGQQIIDVPADRPDAAGKSGLMFYRAPTPGYSGSFPVFVTEKDLEALAAADEADDDPGVAGLTAEQVALVDLVRPIFELIGSAVTDGRYADHAEAVTAAVAILDGSTANAMAPLDAWCAFAVDAGTYPDTGAAVAAILARLEEEPPVDADVVSEPEAAPAVEPPAIDAGDDEKAAAITAAQAAVTEAEAEAEAATTEAKKRAAAKKVAAAQAVLAELTGNADE